MPGWPRAGADVRAALLLLLALTAPAAAQATDPAPWKGRFDHCVHGAEDRAELTACKGLAARLCMEETEGGQTTLGMAGCNAMETRLWDDLLNADWQAHMDWAKQADLSEQEFFGDQFSDRADSLLAAQRAWIAFRDAECRLDYATWGSGSMRHIAGTSCLADMTADRVIRLRSLTEDMQ